MCENRAKFMFSLLLSRCCRTKMATVDGRQQQKQKHNESDELLAQNFRAVGETIGSTMEFTEHGEDRTEQYS